MERAATGIGPSYLWRRASSVVIDDFMRRSGLCQFCVSTDMKPSGACKEIAIQKNLVNFNFDAHIATVK